MEIYSPTGDNIKNIINKVKTEKLKQAPQVALNLHRSSLEIDKGTLEALLVQRLGEDAKRVRVIPKGELQDIYGE